MFINKYVLNYHKHYLIINNRVNWGNLNKILYKIKMYKQLRKHGSVPRDNKLISDNRLAKIKALLANKILRWEIYLIY